MSSAKNQTPYRRHVSPRGLTRNPSCKLERPTRWPEDLILEDLTLEDLPALAEYLEYSESPINWPEDLILGGIPFLDIILEDIESWLNVSRDSFGRPRDIYLDRDKTQLVVFHGGANFKQLDPRYWGRGEGSSRHVLVGEGRLSTSTDVGQAIAYCQFTLKQRCPAALHLFVVNLCDLENPLIDMSTEINLSYSDRSAIKLVNSKSIDAFQMLDVLKAAHGSNFHNRPEYMELLNLHTSRIGNIENLVVTSALEDYDPFSYNSTRSRVGDAVEGILRDANTSDAGNISSDIYTVLKLARDAISYVARQVRDNPKFPADLMQIEYGDPYETAFSVAWNMLILLAERSRDLEYALICSYLVEFTLAVHMQNKFGQEPVDPNPSNLQLLSPSATSRGYNKAQRNQGFISLTEALEDPDLDVIFPKAASSLLRCSYWNTSGMRKDSVLGSLSRLASTIMEDIEKFRYPFEPAQQSFRQNPQSFYNPEGSVDLSNLRQNPEGYIFIYDVGSAPYMAPLQANLDEYALKTLYRELSQKVDSPEMSGTSTELLEANQGTDEYEDLKDLSEGAIDYFVLGAAGGSLDLLVAVRSQEDYLNFIDHMVESYAADISLPGETPNEFIEISAGRGKFLRAPISNPVSAGGSSSYKTFFTSPIRSNPSKLWTDGEILTLGSEEIKRIAHSIAQLESDVWSQLGIRSTLTVEKVLRSILLRKDVICGVAYEDPSQLYGPYVAYVLGYSVDPDDALHARYISTYQRVAGQSFEDLLAEIPSQKLMLMLSWTKEMSSVGNSENMSMAYSLLKYLKANQLGLVGEFRESSSYPIIMRLVKRGSFVLKLDVERPNYLGDGETYHIVVGYFK